MSDITSFEQLDRAIQAVGGKPKVLEALWTGDTQGWYLILSLYTETGWPGFKKEHVQQLGTVSFGGDIRLFTGEVPLWPEAELTKQWGEQARQKYGLEFYFPASQGPDDDCPDWHRRHLGIRCADCNKLIIPTDSPYLPKDVCYPCHLERESNDKIRNDKPYQGGIALYMTKDEEKRQISFCSEFKSFTIAPFVKHHVDRQLTDENVCIVTLDNSNLIQLKADLEEDLEKRLANYQKPDLDNPRTQFLGTFTTQYKGKDYVLMQRFDEDHTTISSLIYSCELLTEALSGEYEYQFYFSRGFTYRDMRVLRFVNSAQVGNTTFSEITAHFQSILVPSQLLYTINKLKEMKCLEVNGDDVRITTLGVNAL